MYLNTKSKYYLGLSQNSIDNNLANILYTPESSKSNGFICLPKSGQKPSEDWVYTVNLHEFSQAMLMPVGVSGDFKQDFSSKHPNLIIDSFPS